eukprot:4553436-Prymnesium_polylepis.1
MRPRQPGGVRGRAMSHSSGWWAVRPARAQAVACLLRLGEHVSQCGDDRHTLASAGSARNLRKKAAGAIART